MGAIQLFYGVFFYISTNVRRRWAIDMIGVFKNRTFRCTLVKTGVSPRGKASEFGSDIQRFESFHPSLLLQEALHLVYSLHPLQPLHLLHLLHFFLHFKGIISKELYQRNYIKGIILKEL